MTIAAVEVEHHTDRKVFEVYTYDEHNICLDRAIFPYADAKRGQPIARGAALELAHRLSESAGMNGRIKRVNF